MAQSIKWISLVLLTTFAVSCANQDEGGTPPPPRPDVSFPDDDAKIEKSTAVSGFCGPKARGLRQVVGMLDKMTSPLMNKVQNAQTHVFMCVNPLKFAIKAEDGLTLTDADLYMTCTITQHKKGMIHLISDTDIEEKKIDTDVISEGTTLTATTEGTTSQRKLTANSDPESEFLFGHPTNFLSRSSNLVDCGIRIHLEGDAPIGDDGDMEDVETDKHEMITVFRVGRDNYSSYDSLDDALQDSRFTERVQEMLNNLVVTFAPTEDGKFEIVRKQ